MATIIPLPSCNERKAPKWDSQNEEQLPTFFEEYETVAVDAGIVDDDERMKMEVLRYVDALTMRFWRTLDTFAGNDKTWDEFKSEILSNYPGAKKLPEATTEDLKKIVRKYAKEGISNTQLLAQYHREFATTAKSLADHKILSAVQTSGYYVQAFPEAFRTRLDTRLQIVHSEKEKGDAYSMTELRTAIDFLLSDASTLSLSIRSLNALIGDRSVHCVVDSGCSIVAMSDTACNVLGLTFDPGKIIPLQSANGVTDFTLGIAKDVPFRFGEVQVFLQVHVVPSPAYDVLIGRPFEVLTQAVIRNFLSGDQHYTITDPNSFKTVTIPTVPRELPRFRKGDEREWRM
ncbi:hypothetical protein BDP27DRAFT_1237023 [Rhodocollybia butyracea]|uniref:Peptidase A2 domain-containing protein n=1 Tax=Rhodocollybia butyracea TaxID=206335 RepID=A0A9P5U0A0_9AGAR|nr:hypothetical protein BDP27DRAFT_1237023 [Rhodocollybia butyracea]